VHWPCDNPERIGARLYAWTLASASGCPCCAFWRGVVIGAAIGALVTFLVH
jgi:hypothetical protein